MRKIERVINGNSVSLLEITVYDEGDIEELKSYRSEKNFILGMDMLPYLDYFENADFVILTGGELGSEQYEPLYRICIRALVIDYENTDEGNEKIDISRCDGLEYLFTRAQMNCINYAKSRSLKTLVVFRWKDNDLRELCDSQIDSLEIIQGELTSLGYINQMYELRALYLSHLRKLKDLSAIRNSKTLEKLTIQCCGKAQLQEFFENETLNYLLISGSNRINSLNDLRGFPKLKYVLLDGCFIEDGNVECLKSIQHAVLFQNRREYSAKDSELPKGEMPYLFTDIPRWRQLTP